MPAFPLSHLLFTLKPNVSFSNAHQSCKNITELFIASFDAPKIEK